VIRKTIRKIRRAMGIHLPVEVAVVLPLGGKVHHFVRKLQFGIWNRHGVLPCAGVDPHITLKIGFQIKTSAIESFSGVIDEWAQKTAPFDVHIKGYGWFDEGIVYLSVEKSEPIVALRALVLADLSRKFGVRPLAVEDDRFRFHVTLCRELERADALDLFGDLSLQTPEFHFVADTLALLIYLEDRWVSWKRAPFCGR